jgi:mono/diheme cytochrome c family protein
MRGILTAALVLAVAGAAHADGYEEHDYLLSCSGCHRADGSGSRLVPSLQQMRKLAGLPGARQYWVQVPGAAQAPLSNARLAALLNWLVERFTGTAPSPRYTAREVERLRRTPLRDPLARRRALLTKTAHPKPTP